jgi:hypothetical protein
MPTDTTEKSLENLIAEALTVGAGYVQRAPKDYDRDYAVDLVKSLSFSPCVFTRRPCPARGDLTSPRVRPNPAFGAAGKTIRAAGTSYGTEQTLVRRPR